MKNVLVAQYTYQLVGEGNGTSNRVEGDTYIYNALPVRAFTRNINDSKFDYGASIDQSTNTENLNPMVPTKEIRLFTEYTGEYAKLGINKPLNFIVPSGPFFRNLEYYIDNTLQQ